MNEYDANKLLLWLLFINIHSIYASGGINFISEYYTLTFDSNNPSTQITYTNGIQFYGNLDFQLIQEVDLAGNTVKSYDLSGPIWTNTYYTNETVNSTVETLEFTTRLNQNSEISVIIQLYENGTKIPTNQYNVSYVLLPQNFSIKLNVINWIWTSQNNSLLFTFFGQTSLGGLDLSASFYPDGSIQYANLPGGTPTLQIGFFNWAKTSLGYLTAQTTLQVGNIFSPASGQLLLTIPYFGNCAIYELTIQCGTATSNEWIWILVGGVSGLLAMCILGIIVFFVARYYNADYKEPEQKSLITNES